MALLQPYQQKTRQVPPPVFQPPIQASPPGQGNNSGGVVSASGFNSNGTYSGGIQPAGNNYPAGIYGAGAGGGGTALGTITPNDLTSHQLTGLIDQNSAYIQQARNGAINQANSRGLLNSSIAAGNAQGEAIKAALPIATADAQANYGLQTTNLNNLAKIQGENINAEAGITEAGTAASASMYGVDANNRGALLRQTNDLAFQGEQAGLNYERNLGYKQQDYYNSSALSDQQYHNALGMSQFGLGASLLEGQQNFYNSAGLAAMNNPAIMGDPAAFGGFLQFIGNPFSNTIDNIFTRLFGSTGGGTPQPASGG